MTSWWFFPTPLKNIMLVKVDHFPKVRDENKKVFETTTQYGCFQKYWYPKMDGWKSWKTPIKMDDLGGPPLFSETPRLLY